ARSDAARRIDGLVRKSRRLGLEAAYYRAVTESLLSVLAQDPELEAAARLAAFTAALGVLARDKELAAALTTPTPALAPETATALLRAVVSGPPVVAALARDLALAARISALPTP